jgi:hypothetical protein
MGPVKEAAVRPTEKLTGKKKGDRQKPGKIRIDTFLTP